MSHPSPEQIVKLLRQADAAVAKGQSVEDFCRRKHISTATYYRWRRKYEGFSVNEAKRLKTLETENAKLKKLLAEVLLANESLQEFLKKKSLTAVERHALIEQMVKHGLSARAACRWAGLSRAVATYALQRPTQDAPRLKVLRRMARRNPRYGYRRVAVISQLGFGTTWRLWKQHNFRLAPQRRRPKRLATTGPNRPCQANHPQHVWTYDILHDRLADRQPFKVLSVLDEFTRECVGILVAPSIRAADVRTLLQRCCRRYGSPEFLRSDNGSEFTAAEVQAWLATHHTGPTFITPGQPWENGFIEAYHDKLRDECLAREWFTSLAEARVVIEKWRKHYNTQRPHSALGYQTPAQFAAAHSSKR